jgi:hypothetical protein
MLQPNLPRELIDGSKTEATEYELPQGPAPIAHIIEPSVQNFWHQRQMHLIASGRQPSTSVGILWAVTGMPFRTYAIEWQLVRTSRKLLVWCGVACVVYGLYRYLW